MGALTVAPEPDASGSPPVSAHRRSDIQGLRAIAVLLVISFHAGLPVPGGFVGVDVFFVISGFVITALLMRGWSLTGRISLSSFYVRRFKRLTPALALMVSVTVVASMLIQSPAGSQQVTAQTAIGAMLLAANIAILRTSGGYFDAAAATNPLLNTWSLSVEEQFYLVFPLVLIGCWVVGRRFRWGTGPAIAAVSVITAGSFLLAVMGALTSGAVQRPIVMGFYGPFPRAWEFGVGSLVALGAVLISRIPRSAANAMYVIGLVGIAASAMVITDSTPFPGPATLGPVLGTALVIAAGTAHRAPPRPWLGSRPMVGVGNASYSLYLWHWPVIVFAALLFPGNGQALLLAAVVSVVPALLAYRFLEDPLRVRKASPRFMAGLVAVSLCVPIGLAAGLLVLADNSWFGLTRSAGRPASAAELDPTCARGAGELCQYPVAGASRGDALLIGDSHAGAMSQAFIDAAHAEGLNAIVFTYPLCPMVSPQIAAAVDETEKWEVQCSDLTAKAADLVERIAPAVVVVSNSYYDQQYGLDLPDLEADYRGTVQAMADEGSAVVLMGPQPVWDTEAFDGGFLAPAPATVSAAPWLDPHRRSNLEMRQAAVVGLDGAVVLDPAPAYCDAGECRRFADGVWLYRDTSHLGVEGADLLVAPLAKAMAQAISDRSAP